MPEFKNSDYTVTKITKDMIMSELEAQFHVWKINERGDYRVALYIPKAEGSPHILHDGQDIPKDTNIVWTRVTTSGEIADFFEHMDSTAPGWDHNEQETRVYRALFILLGIEVEALNKIHEEQELQPVSVFFKDSRFWARVWEQKPEKIRKSVNFARQTQGDAKRARKYKKAAAGAGYQLALEDLLRDTKDVGVKVDTSGIVLSSAEKRLAHGLTVLLAATGEDEKGYPLGDKRAEAVNRKGEREITGYWLFVSANELLEAANYERLDNGRYPQSAKNQLDKTLDSLRINQHKLYVNGIVKGEKFSYTHGVSIVPIVERINFEELPKSKAEKYDPRETFYRIQLHSIWTDKLDTLWLNVPKDIYLELNKAKKALGHRVGGRGYNTHAVDLYDYIFSLSGKNIVTNKLTRATIAERLRLGYLVENRHTLKLDEAIAQAFEELQHMGYISKWEQVEEVYHFEKAEK